MNRLTLITGASSGIGLSITKHLLGLNHNIIAVSRNKINLPKHHRLTHISCDLSKESDIHQIVQQIPKNYKIQHLIHSAGIATPTDPLSKLDYEQINYIIKLNLIAPIFLNNLLIKDNLFNLNARILNISSQAAHDPILDLPAYTVTKAGLFASQRVLQKELEKKQIYLSSLKPGVVDTPLLRNIFKEIDPLIQQQLIQPEWVAEMVEFLLEMIDEKEFISNEWDIYIKSVQKRWVKGDKELPFQPPKLYKTNSD